MTRKNVIKIDKNELNDVRRFFTDTKCNLIFKRIECEDSINGKYYAELPDGYRLIYDRDGYIGRYNPALADVL